MLFVEVLGGEHDRADTDGLAIAVGHGNLALGVRPERWLGSVFATSARRRNIACENWIGAGISASVSEQA